MKKLAWMAILLFTLPSAFAEPIVAEYFSIQDGDSPIAWQQRLAPNTPLTVFNRLYITPAWLYPDTTGEETLQFRYPYEEARLKALVARVRMVNPKAQIFITSGYDDGSMYQAAAKNPKYFAQSVVAFLQAYDLDGYDMDWEQGVDKTALDAILKALRPALNAASVIT